jgi:hypothetical protein
VARDTYAHAKPEERQAVFARLIGEIATGSRKATALHLSTLESGRLRIELDNPGRPVTVFNTAHYNGDWQAALADCTAARGVLEFEPGIITSAVPLVLTNRIEVRGFGWDSQFRYTGTGHAVRCEFADASKSEGTYVHDLRIVGNNSEGQGGIVAGVVGAVPRMLRLERVKVDGFLGGDGVLIKSGVACAVDFATVQGARRGIVMRSCCGSRAWHNWVNYWANSAVVWQGVQNDGVAPRNNSCTENIIHGDPEQMQDVPQDRAGILIDGASNTVVSNNYLEDIDLAPSGAPFVGHGIWIRKTGVPLTQNNTIGEQYGGPNLTGDFIRIDSGVTHTSLRRQQVGTYVVRDNGSFTYFEMLHLNDRAAQLQGSGTNRLGWISNPSGTPTQLHP